MKDSTNEEDISKIEKNHNKKTIYDYLMIVLVILIVILTINLMTGLSAIKPVTTENFVAIMQENGFTINEKDDYLRAKNKRVGVIVDFFELISEKTAESYYQLMMEKMGTTKALGQDELKYSQSDDKINKLHYERTNLTTKYSQNYSQVAIVRAQNTIVVISANTLEKINDTLTLMGYLL